MHVSMQGLLQNCASVTEILEVKILGDIFLVQTVRDKLLREHLRQGLVRYFDRCYVRGITGYYPDVTVGTVFFGLD